jgi:hypothetical protein
MRTERGVGLRPPTNWNCSLGPAPPCRSKDWKVDCGAGGGGLFGSQDGYPSEPRDILRGELEDADGCSYTSWVSVRNPADADDECWTGEAEEGSLLEFWRDIIIREQEEIKKHAGGERDNQGVVNVDKGVVSRQGDSGFNVRGVKGFKPRASWRMSQ